MNRRDRIDYNHNDNANYGLDESRYDGYHNDENYHRARSLKNEFERDYQRDMNREFRNHDRNRNDRGYNDGRMGSSFEEYRREEGGFRENAKQDLRSLNNSNRNADYNNNYNNDRDRNYSDNFSRDRDRFSNYQSDFRGDHGIRRRDENRDSGRHQELRGNIRQGYGISSFDGTSDRYNTLDSDDRKGNVGQDEQAYYSGERDGYRSSRFGGGMGDAFPSSHRGVPDTNYGLRNFADDYGTGMGSSYGGKNYGGGTGYSGGHRGGSLGNSSYGTTAGNYGGYGPMGGSTYGGGRGSSTGDSAHNSDRSVTELGGF